MALPLFVVLKAIKKLRVSGDGVSLRETVMIITRSHVLPSLLQASDNSYSVSKTDA